TPYGDPDTDGDGIPDSEDSTPNGDADGDGIDDLIDPYPLGDPTETAIPPTEAVVPADTVTVTVTFRDEDTGTLVPGSCFTLEARQDDGVTRLPVGWYCDGDDGGTDGAVTLPGLDSFRTYYMTEMDVADGWASSCLSLPMFTGVSGFNVDFMGTLYVGIYLIQGTENCSPPTPTPTATPGPTGSVRITLLDSDGNTIADSSACGYLSPIDGDEWPYACAEDGVLTFTDVPEGPYYLDQFAPEGYRVGPDFPETITVTAGETTEISISFLDDWLDTDYSRVLIHVVDDNGNPLPGLCVSSPDNAPWMSCYWSDEIAPGTYLINHPLPPGTHEFALYLELGLNAMDAHLPFSVVVPSGGHLIEQTIVFSSQVSISLTDNAGTAVPAQCLYLEPGYFLSCDSADGFNDGTVQFRGIPAGSYSIVLPRNYPNDDIVLESGIAIGPGIASRTYDISSYLEPEDPVTLTISVVDESGTPVRSSETCFRLESGFATCDWDRLGVVEFWESVTGSSGIIAISQDPPSPYYEPVPPFFVNIGVTSNITVVNARKPASVRIVSRDVSGAVLPINACFTLVNQSNEDEVHVQCDDAYYYGEPLDGQSWFMELDPGTYSLDVQAGYGQFVSEVLWPYAWSDPGPVIVTAGQTT
ncbi:MAG: hypothetical protein KC438_14210, partial [Thermomicrobiales bacterium]|nr:hypothetical protein [Thermomicrobiales bacterium]